MNGNPSKRPKLESAVDDQQLKCFICRSYLSCSPLRISRNGKNICGRCYPLIDEDVLYFKNPPLEFVLRNSIFPCRFQEHGCTQEVSFGDALQHEDTCHYRQYQKYDCPYLTSEDCSWKGPVSKILDHLVEFHKEMLTQGNEFKLNVKEDKRSKIIMEIHDTFFIISYFYDSKEKILKYNVCYLTLSMHEKFYKVTVFNGYNRGESVNLRNTLCKKYYTAATSTYEQLICMNLESYLKVLEDPDTIVISLYSTNADSALIQKSDYKLLKNLRCKCCRKYIAAPNAENLARICYDSGENKNLPPLIEDENLKQLMAQVSYSCKWPSCEFVGIFDKMYTHEMNCQFREFLCLLEECGKTYHRGTPAIDHYALHGYEHCVNTHVFSMDLDNFYRVQSNVLVKLYLTTPKLDKEKIIYLNFCNKIIVTRGEFSRGFLHGAKVYFQHDHCKKKSKEFTGCIILEDLPKCFQKQPRKYTVTVTIL